MSDSYRAPSGGALILSYRARKSSGFPGGGVNHRLRNRVPPIFYKCCVLVPRRNAMHPARIGNLLPDLPSVLKDKTLVSNTPISRSVGVLPESRCSLTRLAGHRRLHP